MTNHLRTIKYSAVLLILLASMVFECSAQERNCKVSGVVVDEHLRKMEYATVALADENGKIVSGALSDSVGRFVCKVKKSNTPYTLSVEMTGYIRYQVLLYADKSEVEIGTIKMEANPVVLREAVVTAEEVDKRSTVELTSINASSSITASSGSVADVLRNASSVTFEGDGILSIRGNRNILILVDGVPTTLTDLQSIPTSRVKSIDIVTNPDASHDAEGTGGIINIVSKVEKSKGVSGAFSANYGFNHFANGSAAISYNTPKVSYRFNYTAKYEDNLVNGILNRTIGTNSTHQTIRSNRYTFNNNVSIGAEVRANSRNILNIDLKCIVPRLNIQQNLDNIIVRDGIETTEQRHSDISWNRENIDASISYNHTIKPDTSSLYLKASFSKIWGHRPSFYYLNSASIGKSNSGGSPLITALQLDFSQKYKSGTLGAGAKMTYRRNDIYHEFYSWNLNQWQYSNQFSNDLVHQEFVPALYLMFASKPIGKFSYKAGLRGELSAVLLHSDMEKVDTTSVDFFLAPSFSATYDISKKQRLSLALSRRVGRPTYPQLNPYMSMVDANTFEQGNMRLKPEKSTKLDLAYSLNSKYLNIFSVIYLTHTTNYISQITTIDSNLLVTTYINGTSDIKTGCDLTIKVRPAQWMEATVSANTFFVSTKGSYGQVVVDNRGWTNNSNILLTFKPVKGMEIQAQYFLTTPQYFPQLTTSLTHFMNLGIKQSFLKGSLSATLLLTDVFNTYKWEVHTSNGVFDLTNRSTHKSRMLWVGLSYNFNSYKQRKADNQKDMDRSVIRLGL